MVESNGKGKYKPEVEFELQEDVNLWIKKDAEGEETITYPDELLSELEDDEQSESNSDN